MSDPSNDGKIQCINCGKSVPAGSAVMMSPDPDAPLVCRWCAGVIERQQLSKEVDGMKANLQQSFAVDKTLGGLSQSYQACCEYEGLKGKMERLREQLAAATEMIQGAMPFAKDYSRRNPGWTPTVPGWAMEGLQDPNGVHAWLEKYQAGWIPQPQENQSQVKK